MMARNKPFKLEAFDRDGCGLRVSFNPSDDSYTQTIDAVAGGAASPLLIANPSPPFQEIVTSVHKSVEIAGPAEWPALLLTGSGDGAYWSASAIAMTDARLAVISFDFACRSGRRATPAAITFDVA